MDTGTGIAIAGVWAFAGMCVGSENVTNTGSWIGIVVALLVTYFI